MNNRKIKISLIAIWGLIFANQILVFPSWLSISLNTLGTILVVAHLIEFFTFKEKIAAKGDSSTKAFVMTIVFGLAYIHAR